MKNVVREYPKYTEKYENEFFIFWFEKVYGKRQAAKLKKIAIKKGKSPFNCVNYETQTKYGDVWNLLKIQYRKNWRI